MTEFRIAVDDLSGRQIAELLRFHQADMRAGCPPESVHALDLPALQAPEVTFWCAWSGDELAGCGALKQLTADSGEIKSMRTADRHLRKGVASRILHTIIEEATRRHYRNLFLETGSLPQFTSARTLYAGNGFTECQPFAEYREDPNSVYMRLSLA